MMVTAMATAIVMVKVMMELNRFDDDGGDGDDYMVMSSLWRIIF